MIRLAEKLNRLLPKVDSGRGSFRSDSGVKILMEGGRVSVDLDDPETQEILRKRLDELKAGGVIRK